MTDIVEWRQSAHPDYEVSEYGQLRSLVSRSHRPAGSVLTGTVDKHGYIAYNLHESGNGKRGSPRKHYKAHTLVLLAFVGPKPSDKHQCAHWDGNPSNNHYTNLRWATAAENCEDKIRHGNHRKGNKKLTAEQVLEIRAMHKNGKSYKMIREKYPIAKGTLSAIINRQTWDHI